MKNPTNKNVKPSDILRKAASILNSDLSKNIRRREGCCDALARAAEVLVNNGPFDIETRASRYFRSLFKPANPLASYWFGDNDLSCYDFRKKTQEHRIMALLMTAEMAESVGE